jgi:hypothetical protein
MTVNVVTHMDLPWRRGAAPEQPDFILGCDLGKIRDFTALALLERSRRPDEGGRRAYHYQCRHLHRFPLNTPYVGADGEAGVAEGLAELLGKLPGRAALVLDATGPGVSVADVLRKAKLPVSQLVAVVITGGHAPPNRPEGAGCWNVAKRHLASTLLAVVGTRRLAVAPSLPLANVLVEEMGQFTMKVSAETGNETYESWRERDHDDLVLALALACWWGEFACRRIILAV